MRWRSPPSALDRRGCLSGSPCSRTEIILPHRLGLLSLYTHCTPIFRFPQVGVRRRQHLFRTHTTGLCSKSRSTRRRHRQRSRHGFPDRDSGLFVFLKPRHMDGLPASPVVADRQRAYVGCDKPSTNPKLNKSKALDRDCPHTYCIAPGVVKWDYEDYELPLPIPAVRTVIVAAIVAVASAHVRRVIRDTETY